MGEARGPGRPLGTRQTIAPEFTRLRVGRGLSHSRIALLARARGLSISKSTLAALEIGELVARRHHLRAIAAALELPLAELVPYFSPTPRR